MSCTLLWQLSQIPLLNRTPSLSHLPRPLLRALPFFHHRPFRYLKIKQPLLKFSTGSGTFTLQPDIFVSDTNFQINNLTLPVFGENLLYSFDFQRFSQIETQGGFLFLPSRPSTYLNPLSLQLPPQSIRQNPIPSSPPHHLRHHPPPSSRYPPPPRDWQNVSRPGQVDEVSKCLTNLSIITANNNSQNSSSRLDTYIMSLAVMWQYLPP